MQLPLNCTARHYTNCTTLRYNYNYTTLRYTTLDCTTLYQTTVHSTTVHYNTLFTPHHNYNYKCNCSCSCSYTTLTTQLTTTAPLHYNYTCTTPHYIQQLWWGDRCNHCNHSKKHSSNHLSVHQWIRSAIRDSQQLTSPIGFLFLKLPPPPYIEVRKLYESSIHFHLTGVTWPCNLQVWRVVKNIHGSGKTKEQPRGHPDWPLFLACGPR